MNKNKVLEFPNQTSVQTNEKDQLLHLLCIYCLFNRENRSQTMHENFYARFFFYLDLWLYKKEHKYTF